MRVSIKQVEKLVKENNISGVVSMSFENRIHTILSSNGGNISFTDSQTAGKVYRILTNELFFSKPDNFMNQDEFDGLCQANQLGFKTFECTILG